MEAVIRKPYQGVINIIRFNWHFYVMAGVSVAILFMGARQWDGLMFWSCVLVAMAVVISACISLVVSHYVYDRSSLYDFRWLRQFDKTAAGIIVNIHAGFDETSGILKRSFPDADLRVFDFYDPIRHTEISIERARKAYPPYPGTVKITTSELPLAERSIDLIFSVFALHEIRERGERIHFLQEQVRVLRQDGKIVVVEHLRDVPNFLAYNIGFFHFMPGGEWDTNFQQAGLRIDNTFRITPFITVFILQKADGTTP
jgi:SAM-dependent methyltransferase